MNEIFVIPRFVMKQVKEKKLFTTFESFAIYGFQKY